jgi:hypothetical protein
MVIPSAKLVGVSACAHSPRQSQREKEKLQSNSIWPFPVHDIQNTPGYILKAFPSDLPKRKYRTAYPDSGGSPICVASRPAPPP